MRVSSIVSLSAFAVAAFFAPAQLSATTPTTASAALTTAAATANLVAQAKCEMIDGHVTCKKNKHQSHNDDDHHKTKNNHKDENNGKDDESENTQTAKLKLVPGSCAVTHEAGTEGGGGISVKPGQTARCEKTKSGTTVCCRYEIAN